MSDSDLIPNLQLFIIRVDKKGGIADAFSGNETRINPRGTEFADFSLL
jgi:hypothetical protein